MLDARHYIYIATLLFISGGAIAFGRTPERIGGVVNLLASLASLLVAMDRYHAWRGPMVGIWLVDCATAGAFFALAARTDRFWPIWSFGFTMAGVMATVARTQETRLPFLVYFNSEAIWAYPSLFVLAIGTWRARVGPKMPKL